jgi:ribose 5-phosphate isomerase RpiB
MIISIGADHVGFAMKKQLIGVVKDLGHTVHDVGTHQGVEHDDMNVLVLGSRIIGPMAAQDSAEAFLKAKFSGEERHVRRLNKVKGIEENEFR